MSQKPDITLYSLEVSRSIRIAWLLEELNLPYNLVSSPRGPDNAPPQEFKDKIPTFLKRSPTLIDHGLVLQESGTITDYLCEMYDPENRFIPASGTERFKVREFIAAAEGTTFMHIMPVLYAKWRIPEANADVRDTYVEAISGNIRKDLDWVEQELAKNEESSGGGETIYMVGNHLTAADTMMHIGLQAIFARGLGTEGLSGTGRWARVERWLEQMRGREAWKRAAEKINFAGTPKQA